MTTTSEKPESSAKIRWGAHFKATREAMHLSEKDAASRLHLNAAVIILIETETFKNSDTPAIFMRGYVRSYARLLNISDKHINQALNDLGLADTTTSKVSSPALLAKKIDTRKTNNQFTSWSTAIVVLVLVGLVGMWWNTHSRNNAADTAAMAENNTQGTTSTPAVPSDPTPKELITPVAQAENDAPAPTPPPAPTSVAQTEQTPSNLPTSEQTASVKPVEASAKPATSGETPPGLTNNDNPTAASDMQADATGVTPLPGSEQTPATDLTEQAPVEKPVLAKKHTRHHQPIVDSNNEDMAVPEAGLMPEPGAEADPNETN